jgi:hypothetical protein
MVIDMRSNVPQVYERSGSEEGVKSARICEQVEKSDS